MLLNRRLRVASCLALVVACRAASCGAEEPISFNKQIRPILADRCYKCHGPDTASREAGLRLDREESATQALADSGNVAIVPHKPADSEIMVRLTDTDQLMPPPDSMLSVSKEEIELIRRWIAQGAKWERHWAFLPPRKAALPKVKDESWCREPLDWFVLKRLETEGLAPSQPADRARWLRRVTFDLTGLPPTLSALQAFLSDKSEKAHEKAVDRLLDSPAFGERMALDWLDVARYGDTDGLFEDHPRSIYPWRDWVVGAFNQNLPYSDFLRWQLAGDLLPNPSEQQRIATGFVRNNPTSNEGGIIDEDYRIKYLIDRVNTTATAMLGLTLECAQCHDHKYDPMTQREYYQFSGFFNSLVGNGNTKGSTAPTLLRFTDEQKQRREQVNRDLANVKKTLASTPAELTAAFETWLKSLDRPVEWQPMSLIASEQLRDDNGWLTPMTQSQAVEAKATTPTKQGRYVRVTLPPQQTGFLTISEVQVFANGRNIASTGKATQSSVDYASPAAKAIDGNHDGSFKSCSCTKSEPNAWWELDLQAEFPITSVAVWNRTDCCPERLDKVSIRILDANRKQVAERILGKATARNALPANAKEMDSGTVELTATLHPTNANVRALRLESPRTTAIELIEAAVVQKGAKAVPLKLSGERKASIAKDKPAVFGLETALVLKTDQSIRLKLKAPAKVKLRVSTTDNPTAEVRESLPKRRDKRMAYFRDQWSGFAAERNKKAALEKQAKVLEGQGVVTMIAADLPKPRTNYLLKRGEYDNRGEIVPTSAPASIMPYGEEFPKNRLGLSAWLTHQENPLAARVAVNRYWQMVFGVGIVKTSEDFGTQGDQPSHQELLDFLAVEFMESGWDVKQLIRRLVLSATYRQASKRNGANAAADPENRLLSRGPRRRLQAESLRDHALSISGLLVDKRGGPGVHPYQPAELFGRNAIGAANTKFTQSSGDDLYRRSLYTYWKRQIPAANMRILGADGRTTCRTRRESTNTPLQALVMLNDPQFVEAARALASRSMVEGGKSIADRISFAFQLATSRAVSSAELAILTSEFQDRLREFSAAPEAARKYLAGGGQFKPPANQDQAELAAYAAVCSLIMNLDESLSSS